MATTPDDTADSPYCHDNWWFDEQTDDDSNEKTDDTTDTRATPTTDRSVAASTIMHQEVLALADPICARSKREDGEDVTLSDPTFYLPKQRDHGDRVEEYRQHNQPRRINQETGYIAGGETTSVGLPELDEDAYRQAVRNVLARLGFLEAHREDWLQHADRLYHDPTCNSTRALRLFVQHKLAYDRGDRPAPFGTS